MSLRPIAVLLLIAFTTLGLAQEPQRPLTRMLFVFDASNSMNAFWGNQPKINTARFLLLKSLAELEGQPDLELALRVYGHQTRIEAGKQDCDDTKLEVPFSANSIPSIRRTLEQVHCLGTTPIARSLEKAGGDFPALERGGRQVRNIIILITDGIEACDEDPCAVSRALQSKGIVLKPFVIGVGLEDGQKYSLQCVGNYYDASTPELFEQVLQVVVTQALNSTTAEIDLLTDDGKPTETNVPVTLYDQKTGAVKYHIVHTMNDRNVPDTVSIDPIFTYRLVVHSIPPVERSDVKVMPGIHNKIPVSAGQGGLELKVQGIPNEIGWNDARAIQCIVHPSNDDTILHVQQMGTTERYRTGTYDLEILTLPRMRIDDVMVKQGATTPVQIPQPGVLNAQLASAGDGAIFLKDGSNLVWVTDLDVNSVQQQFRLLPGTYQVIYRSGNARKTEYSIIKDVTIAPGQSATLNF
ncbi:MAG: vWA domain-containing protein [Flavobacteriales bacterium]